jgi:uncharacterized protein (TIGR01777 family)
VSTRAIDTTASPDLSGLDAMVNLAGESIMGRWSASKQRRIRESRIGVTRALIEELPTSKVRVLVSASATGIYGHRGEELLTEASAPGTGFLADVCGKWEAEAMRARTSDIRVVLPRIGFVVSPHGGGMDRIRPIFRFGLGGRLGDGQQWMPWVHVIDVADFIVHALESESCYGAFNAVSPNPVRNVDFTRSLAATLHRPAFFAVPATVLRTTLGEFSSLVLDSQRVAPERTLASGYAFQFPTLSDAI